MKRKDELLFVWIIIAPVVCAIVAKVAANHFAWGMFFAVAYTISIIMIIKGKNMGNILKEGYNWLTELSQGAKNPSPNPTNKYTQLQRQVRELQKELDCKTDELNQYEELNANLRRNIEELRTRIAALEGRCRELEYRWKLWQDWAILQQKRYYDESDQRQDDIRMQLEDCGFSLEHYNEANEEWFTIEVLNKLPDEPEYKETKPALVFINDGNKELISKGTLLKFVDESNQ